MPRALRRILTILAPAVLVLLSLGTDCDREEAMEWQPVWQGEFDGPAGQLPDTAN
jgi:hypothetical protein